MSFTKRTETRKMGRCSTVRVTFFNKLYNSLTQLNRMWLSHG